MKYILLMVLSGIVFILAGCSQTTQINSPTSNQEQENVRQVFVLGDSLSAGYQLPLEQSYPMILEQLLAANGYPLRVINGGESGDTSAGLQERVNRITAQAQSGDIALVVIGGNDGLQGLPLSELEQNIQSIIQNLQTRGIITIIGGMQIPTNLGTAYRSGFAALYPRIAQQTNSILIPFILSGVAGIPELNLPDGIHPNASGQAIVAKTVYDALYPILSSDTTQ